MAKAVTVFEDASGGWHATKGEAERVDRRSDFVMKASTLITDPDEMGHPECLADWLNENRQTVANYLGATLKD